MIRLLLLGLMLVTTGCATHYYTVDGDHLSLVLAQPDAREVMVACSLDGFEPHQAVKETGRSQVIIAGMEAHVCVYQTVLGLLEDGYHVHLLSDAICSRNKTDYLSGVANAGQAGAVVTTAETVLFQMLQESTHEQFKAISKLVKERD